MTDGTQPEFALSRRGYDPAEVDEFVAASEAALSDARSRLRASEGTVEQLRREVADLRAAEPDDPDAPPRSIAALGDRVAAILQAAADAGDALRAEASRFLEQAGQVHAEAEAAAVARAEELLARARVEAERRVQEASATADLLLADARAEADRVEESANGALAARTSAHEDLRRVRDVLEEVLDRLPVEAVAVDLREGSDGHAG